MKDNTRPREADVKILMPLQVIGAISALVFAINFCLEILILGDLGHNHQLLIMAWLLTLSVWSIAEAFWLRARAPTLPLGKLKLMLMLQLLLEGVRLGLLLKGSSIGIDRSHDIEVVNLGQLIVLLPAYVLMFLGIGRTLIACHTSELASAYQAIVRLEQSALRLTDSISVGTYTMVLLPGEELARFSFLSKRFLEMTGLTREQALGDPLQAFACVHPDDHGAWVRLNVEAFAKRAPFYGETRVIVHGEVRWVSAEAIPRQLSDGGHVWEGVLIDVTAQKQAQAQLQKLATTDTLTGAWNRRHLENVVANEMARQQRHKAPLSLMVMDIDHFKQINDRHGHGVGDQVLVSLVDTIRSSLRSTDILARWGGEEFVVLTPMENLDSCRQIAERFRESSATATFPVVGQITISIGVAEVQAGDSWEQAFARADAALYRAKAEGRNRVQTSPTQA
jgi:diguanylate cyclase (GGDEF)-like protein/PAS domain S-box-containing protein